MSVAKQKEIGVGYAILLLDATARVPCSAKIRTKHMRGGLKKWLTHAKIAREVRLRGVHFLLSKDKSFSNREGLNTGEAKGIQSWRMVWHGEEERALRYIKC